MATNNRPTLGGDSGVVDDVRGRLTSDGWERELALSAGGAILAAFVLSRFMGGR